MAIAILVPLELENLVILRWKYSLENGNDDARPRVARFSRAPRSRGPPVGANLSEADLAGADISRADLSGANLASSTVAKAKGWLETSCSRTTAMPRSFACVDGRPAGTAP